MPNPAETAHEGEHDHHHHHDPEDQLREAQEMGFGEAFFEHALTPANVGLIPNADGFAMPKGACGDFIELYLRIEDKTITDARFMPQGCLHTVACGSVVTELAKGRTVAQALDVSADDIEGVLGGLPKDHRHCAVLAAATLKAAVRDHFKKNGQDWKKLYQK